MTDCMSCRHAEPARAPDGSVDFRIKNCKFGPPTPVVLVGAGGQLQVSAMFPTVGPGVRCGQHAVRESLCCGAYSSLVLDGRCRTCGFPKAAHAKTFPKEGEVCPTCSAAWCGPTDAPGKLRIVHLKPMCRGVGLVAIEEVDAP